MGHAGKEFVPKFGSFKWCQLFLEMYFYMLDGQPFTWNTKYVFISEIKIFLNCVSTFICLDLDAAFYHNTSETSGPFTDVE